MMESIKDKVKSTIWKLKQPGVKRSLLLLNIGGMTYYWIASILLSTLNLFYLIPTLYEDSPSMFIFHRALYCFLLFNMMVNYFLSTFKHSYFEAISTNANINAESAAKGWAYCTPCQQYIPPRCHHCPICERCILKRDSHCFFTGHCVGFRNQRYFLVFLFYAIFAAMHSAFCLGSFIGMYTGSFFSTSIVNYIYPIATIMWMFGSMQTFVYGTLTVFYMSLAITTGCTGLFVWHFRHALQGQTSHEATTGNTKYRHTSVRNLEDIFGKFWIMSFIFPLPVSQPGDGTTWNQCKSVKGY